MKDIKIGGAFLVVVVYVIVFLVGSQLGWSDQTMHILFNITALFLINWVLIHPLIAITFVPCIAAAEIAEATMGGYAGLIAYPSMCIAGLVLIIGIIIWIHKTMTR